MAYDLSSKTVSGRDWSCGASPAPEKLSDAIDRINHIMSINSQKVSIAINHGALSELERQNYDGFARDWDKYIFNAPALSRLPPKQLQAELNRWTVEANARTVRLDKKIDDAKASLKRLISARPPEKTDDGSGVWKWFAIAGAGAAVFALISRKI